MLHSLKLYKQILLPFTIIMVYLLSSLTLTAQIKSLVDSNAVKVFSGQPSKDSIVYSDIYLMSSFDDSVVISLGKRKVFSKFCKTHHSLGMAASITLLTPEEGEIITFYCFNQKLLQTIKFKRGYAYLYVWKALDKFQFEFTNELRWLQ